MAENSAQNLPCLPKLTLSNSLNDYELIAEIKKKDGVDQVCVGWRRGSQSVHPELWVEVAGAHEVFSMLAAFAEHAERNLS